MVIREESPRPDASAPPDPRCCTDYAPPPSANLRHTSSSARPTTSFAARVRAPPHTRYRLPPMWSRRRAPRARLEARARCAKVGRRRSRVSDPTRARRNLHVLRAACRFYAPVRVRIAPAYTQPPPVSQLRSSRSSDNSPSRPSSRAPAAPPRERRCVPPLRAARRSTWRAGAIRAAAQRQRVRCAAIAKPSSAAAGHIPTRPRRRRHVWRASIRVRTCQLLAPHACRRHR